MRVKLRDRRAWFLMDSTHQQVKNALRKVWIIECGGCDAGVNHFTENFSVKSGQQQILRYLQTIAAQLLQPYR